MKTNYSLLIIGLLWIMHSFGQEAVTLSGTVSAQGIPQSYIQLGIKELSIGCNSDANGCFTFEPIKPGTYTLVARSYDFDALELSLTLTGDTVVTINLEPKAQLVDEVVVSGNLREVSKLASVTPVELYQSSHFKHNPTCNVFDGLQSINGVRPQVNCNICNTGDIHINGLEGPYTMVLIDGMPNMNSLSTVYGLAGIPMAIVDRIEVVRGPASTLYGSQAIGGIINVITKSPTKSPRVALESMGTSWGEINTDLALANKLGKRSSLLTGINYFNYQLPQDNNKDGFTDVTLQHRISIFEKWQLQRPNNRIFQLAAKYFYEDRWGGEMNWTPTWRGTDSIYGESIYTNRAELFMQYQLPIKDTVLFSSSYTYHHQNSFYGTMPFHAVQQTFFNQLVYYKTLGNHGFVSGIAVNTNYYNDDTPATSTSDSSDYQPVTVLPGLFIQDDWLLTSRMNVLAGIRYDYSAIHGSILTPRLGLKYSIGSSQVIRLNTGTGYRTVNVFTEDHAALTGSRTVEMREALNPERSYNINLNYYGSFVGKKGWTYIADFSAFYTYFNNKIAPDYLTDPNKIIYENIHGFAVSQGINVTTTVRSASGVKLQTGITLLDVQINENGQAQRQLLTERFSGTWTLTIPVKRLYLTADYTGNVYAPMLLPVLGSTDPRPTSSPWWSMHNVKLSFTRWKSIELFGGVKNILNWTPAKGVPFLIARSNDPFDKQVSFDADGNALATTNNPNALTFDPSYVYAPNQGIRGFLGISWKIN